jgi:drug/metabolite transporter (DMT)-like permease
LKQGVGYMIIASLCFAVMNVWIKQLQEIPLSQIVFFRSFVVLILLSFVLNVKKISPWGGQKKLLLFRGITGTLGIVLFFFTLKSMPLASAVVIHYLTPIFTIVVSVIFLKKSIKKHYWLYISLCLLGIILIRGFDPRVSSLSLILGITGTISASIAYNIISFLKNTENSLVIMFYFPLVTTPVVLAYMIFTKDWVTPSFVDWFKLIGIGFVTYAAQYYLTKAYQIGDLLKVSVVSYSGIIYALLFGFMFFGEWFKWPVLLGIIMVVSGVILAILSNHRMIKSSKK